MTQSKRFECYRRQVRTNSFNICSSYTYEDEEGVYAESQFVFDLELPLEFKPTVGDGEVQDFYLLPIDKVCIADVNLKSLPVK